jgi:protein O-mannosyl-transferase
MYTHPQNVGTKQARLLHQWSPQSLFAQPAFAETLVCAIVALAYVATLSFGFAYDDVPQILKNPAVHAWRFVPQYFTGHVWAAIYANSAGNYYRPIFLLWLRLNYALFGMHAAGWHLTSVACHVLATWLVFRVAQQLASERALAFVAALVFGLHPAHIENVAWISGATDPVMACFVLGSFSAFLSFRGSGGVWRACESVALFGLGLLTKETAVVLPVLVLAYTLIVERGERSLGGEESGRDARSTAGGTPALRSLPRPSWALLAGFVGVALIYLWARFRALGGWSHSTATIGWKEVLLTWPAVLWFYVRHLFWPVRLSEFYSLDYVSHAMAAAVLEPLGLLLLVALVVTLVLRFIREHSARRLALFALVFIIVPLLPVLDLRSLTAGDVVHDRYLYLPSVGFALLMAILIRELARRFRVSLHDFVLTAVVTAIGITFAVLTVSQQMSWASDILLYTRGLESAPGNLTVRDNLANALMDANQPERAIPLYLEVLRSNPAFWRSNYNLGFAYYKTGNFAAAEEYLTRAIQIDASDSDQYVYLALAQLELKKLSEAGENARRALLRNPQARGYHLVAGLIYEREDDRERAAEEFKAEIAEHPDNAAALAELRRVESGQSSARP